MRSQSCETGTLAVIASARAFVACARNCTTSSSFMKKFTNTPSAGSTGASVRSVVLNACSSLSVSERPA